MHVKILKIKKTALSFLLLLQVIFLQLNFSLNSYLILILLVEML